ncbi:unnamed protein product [Ambrosiozyma monospora]|uniref:Unnamed protein product n=1 Tax=Ambrosiozyma monospora TaxID=43982 RepID=A0ACB5SWF8_AMBMO|nr:unnamed protein product [Ambrosiozyma monospora]
MRLTSILVFDAYWQCLRTDLDNHGYTESIDKFLKGDYDSRLTNFKEEEYLTSFLEKTINEKILSYKDIYASSHESPSLYFLGWLKEKRDFILKQKHIMKGLKVEGNMSIQRLHSRYNDIKAHIYYHQACRRLLNLDEFVLKYAFKSLQNSARYSSWTQTYAEDSQVSEINKAHLAFSDLDDLFQRAKPSLVATDIVWALGILFFCIAAIPPDCALPIAALLCFICYLSINETRSLFDDLFQRVTAFLVSMLYPALAFGIFIVFFAIISEAHEDCVLLWTLLTAIALRFLCYFNIDEIHLLISDHYDSFGRYSPTIVGQFLLLCLCFVATPEIYDCCTLPISLLLYLGANYLINEFSDWINLHVCGLLCIGVVFFLLCPKSKPFILYFMFLFSIIWLCISKKLTSFA